MKNILIELYLGCSISIFLLLNAYYINCTSLNSLNKKNEMKLSSEMKTNTKSKLTTKFCNPLCRECAVNDMNYCTICTTGIVLYQFTCANRCPEGTFMDELTRECRICSSNCPVCWGPNPDMCGTIPGIITKVVFLEKEIKDFLTTYTFTQKEIEIWIESLKIILDSKDESLVTDLNSDSLSSNEVYNTNYKEADLPIGSYSKLNGIFIPVPAYLNIKKILVNSHWVFKKGMWDGKRWVEQYFPRLPKFIKSKGQKNKIYYENGGFWIWDQMRDWYWMKTNKIVEEVTSVEDSLNMLNLIKIDLGDYNRRRFKEMQDIKKLKIANNLRGFFDKFLNTDRLIFSEMKNTINEEQTNFIRSMDDLKNQAHQFFGEDSLGKSNNTNNDKPREFKQYDHQLITFKSVSPKKAEYINEFINKINSINFSSDP